MKIFEVSVVLHPSKVAEENGAEMEFLFSKKLAASNEATAAFKVGVEEAARQVPKGWRLEVTVRPT